MQLSGRADETFGIMPSAQHVCALEIEQTCIWIRSLTVWSHGDASSAYATEHIVLIAN